MCGVVCMCMCGVCVWCVCASVCVSVYVWCLCVVCGVSVPLCVCVSVSGCLQSVNPNKTADGAVRIGERKRYQVFCALGVVVHA